MVQIIYSRSQIFQSSILTILLVSIIQPISNFNFSNNVNSDIVIPNGNDGFIIVSKTELRQKPSVICEIICTLGCSASGTIQSEEKAKCFERLESCKCRHIINPILKSPWFYYFLAIGIFYCIIVPCVNGLNGKPKQQATNPISGMQNQESAPLLLPAGRSPATSSPASVQPPATAITVNSNLENHSQHQEINIEVVQELSRCTSLPSYQEAQHNTNTSSTINNVFPIMTDDEDLPPPYRKALLMSSVVVVQKDG